jgi:hypothetical protein
MQLTSFLALSTLIFTSLAAPSPGIQTPTEVGSTAKIVVLDDAPPAPSADASLTKRAPPETVILANCDPNGSSKSSNALYYAAGHDASGGPDDDCGVQGGGLVTWEGRKISCQFKTGVTLSASIDSGAQGKNNFEVVGSATNGFRGFTCRKDDKHVVWSGSSFTCRSIYYCQV